jgi:sensor histidine kinase YesM
MKLPKPYIVIFVLCFFVAIARSTVIKEWPWYIHVIGYFGQVVAFILMWELIQVINKKLGKYYSFERNPVTRIVLQVLVSIILFFPIFFVTYHLVRPYLPPFFDSRFLTIIYMLIFFVLLFLNFSFYAYEFFQEWQQAANEKALLQLQAERSEKERSLMKYHHLRNQVNPHFLFNTLSSLDGLILSDPELASQFVRHLSKVYRYVLEHSETDVVSLETEIEFIQHYIAVLKMKYNGALSIDLNISKDASEKGIAMVTLQMLIDNAIKHNQVHSSSPLKIVIEDDSEFISIRNNKQLRKQIESSTRHGLRQLKELYSYLSEKPVEISDNTSSFEVKLPLL